MVELIDGVGVITDITEHIEEMIEEKLNRKQSIFKRAWEVINFVGDNKQRIRNRQKWGNEPYKNIYNPQWQ